MDLLKSTVGSEVGLRLLLCPLNSNIVTRAACCTVGIVLPVYSTLGAIERKDQHQQHKWLLYWADPLLALPLISCPGSSHLFPVKSYGSFSLVEVFSDKILYWFRPYYYFKFAFLVWLQLPNFNGAKQLYTSHLKPFFLKHQAICDQVMGLTYVQLVKFVSAHQAEIVFIKAMIVKMFSPDKTSEPPAHNEMEGQISVASDTESDLDD